MTKPVDPEIVTTQLRGMQQDLRALEEALRQLTDALTEEEQAQLSPQAKEGLQRLRTRTSGTKVELLLPKEAAPENQKTSTQIKKKNIPKPKQTKAAKTLQKTQA